MNPPTQEAFRPSMASSFPLGAGEARTHSLNDRAVPPDMEEKRQNEAVFPRRVPGFRNRGTEGTGAVVLQ